MNLSSMSLSIKAHSEAKTKIKRKTISRNPSVEKRHFVPGEESWQGIMGYFTTCHIRARRYTGRPWAPKMPEKPTLVDAVVAIKIWMILCRFLSRYPTSGALFRGRSINLISNFSSKPISVYSPKFKSCFEAQTLLKVTKNFVKYHAMSASESANVSPLDGLRQRVREQVSLYL